MNDVSLSILVPTAQDRAGQRDGGLRAPVARLWRFALSGYRRHRQRRALGQLDERLLRDIGITPAQARKEAGKPFWRA